MKTQYKDTQFEFEDESGVTAWGNDIKRAFRCVTLTDPDPMAMIRVRVRIVAWNEAPTTGAPMLVMRIHLWKYDTTLPKVDLAPHRAFIAGDLPAPLYADWLEENGVTVPREAAELLRGW